MQLEEAIKAALDGHALLFVGAGFSCKATNLDEKSFPMGGDFSEDLCNEMGCAPNKNLSLISDIYMWLS